MLHSGFEAAKYPNIWQTRAAKAAIDAGASVVVGAHPHVLKGARRYKGGFIAYSLGNFVFNRTNDVSAILKVVLDGHGVRETSWVLGPRERWRAGIPDERTTTYVKNLIRGLSMPLGGP